MKLGPCSMDLALQHAWSHQTHSQMHLKFLRKASCCVTSKVVFLGSHVLCATWPPRAATVSCCRQGAPSQPNVQLSDVLRQRPLACLAGPVLSKTVGSFLCWEDRAPSKCLNVYHVLFNHARHATAAALALRICATGHSQVKYWIIQHTIVNP